MTLNIITPSHFPSKANNRQHFHVSEGCMQALFEEAQRLTAVDHPRWIIRNMREISLSDSDDWMKILIFHPFSSELMKWAQLVIPLAPDHLLAHFLENIVQENCLEMKTTFEHSNPFHSILSQVLVYSFQFQS